MPRTLRAACRNSPRRGRHAAPTRGRRLAALAVIAALATTSWTVTTHPEPAHAAAHRTVAARNKPVSRAAQSYGINLGDVGSQLPRVIDAKLADIRRLGFTWVRQDFSWANIQPKGPHTWFLARLDLITTLAARHHLHVLGVLDYAPPWAAAANCARKAHCAPRDTRQFASFARVVAQHFRGRVSAWEIWNEENVASFWAPRPSPRAYTQLLRQSYSAIHRVAPKTTVIAGGLSNAGPGSSKALDAVSFLRGMYRSGLQHHFDALAYHPYTFPKYPSQSWAWKQIPELRALMTSHGDGARPIWLTEFGAPTSGTNFRHVTAARQAQLAKATFDASRKLPYVRADFWYCYEDISKPKRTTNHFYGLVQSRGTHKPAYYMWKSLLH